MATPIVVSCPECKKQMNAPEQVRGKRVRCKGCGHSFQVPAGDGNKPVGDEEAYGVIHEDESIPRCPHCAKEMASADAVICINCGFNTVTRQRAGTKKVIETTGGEHFAWLLPGILCLVFILALIGFDLFFCLKGPDLLKDGDYEFLGAKPVRTWTVIGSGFMIFFAGQFAFRRLILHPHPPEREKDI
jgi:hypothetical protein